MAITQEQIDDASKLFCLPCTLLLNFGLFQYLLTVFYRRRHEPAVRALLVIAFVSFVSLIPSAHKDLELVRNLNDISEACTVLSFLLQISILTRDVNKKVKLPTVVKLARVAELLSILGFVVIIANIIDIAAPLVDMTSVELLDHIAEYMSLAFVVGFRFYFLAMARGAAKVWQKQKHEVFYYLLLATHTLPFHLINYATGLDWLHVQGLWMRCIIAMCLSSTIRTRFASMNSKSGISGSSGGSIPSNSVFEANSAKGPTGMSLYTASKGAKQTSVCPTPGTLPAMASKANAQRK